MGGHCFFVFRFKWDANIERQWEPELWVAPAPLNPDQPLAHAGANIVRCRRTPLSVRPQPFWRMHMSQIQTSAGTVRLMKATKGGGGFPQQEWSQRIHSPGLFFLAVVVNAAVRGRCSFGLILTRADEPLRWVGYVVLSPPPPPPTKSGSKGQCETRHSSARGIRGGRG